ncbi:MAG: preprotein translocase subunit SecE [Clostridiaceae bacterium]|nr:preprotein translocase subunit SecE [Clostridiaceae bacterium]
MKDNKNLENGQNDARKSDKPVPKKKSFVESARKLGRSIGKWGRDLKGEVKKVVWPSWKPTRNNSIVVISVVAIVTVAVWLMDLLFESVILKGLLALVTGF